DYSLKSIDLKSVYAFKPIPEGLNAVESKHILGSECNMWTEHAPQELVDSKLFPRILAMSEVLWTPSSQQHFEDFHQRLQKQYPRLDRMGVKYGYESLPVSFDIQYKHEEKGFEVKMKPGQQSLKIQYTLDGNNPDKQSPAFEKPIIIRNSGEIKARVFNSSDQEPEVFKRKLILHEGVGKSLILKHAPSQFYAANGANSLCDGQKASSDFHDGLWLGFQEHDLDVVIDLGEQKNIHEIAANFIRSMPSWILFPESVEYLVSDNGKDFQSVSLLKNTESQKEEDMKEQLFKQEFKALKARYIKVIGKKVDVCPEWHEAAGSKAWLFVDEIIIK
ncbi:MAG: family 20 glycosylhydrolase, partial [Bacteroidia bacterium]